MRFSVAVALTLVGASLAKGQTVRVVDDPRAEVIGILFRIAGASDFRSGAVQPYLRQIDSAFAPFKDHPVFQEINRLRRQYGLSLSAVTTMAPQVTDPVTFGERAPIDAPSSTLSGSWRGAEARQFLAQARDFARVARVADFLRAQQPVYDSASARMRRLVDSRGHVDWLGRFFGAPPGDVFIVSPLLVNASGNFAADFKDGTTQERYAFMGVSVADSLGFPVIDPDVLPIVIHEFNHSFVNHVVDARAGELRPAGERIYQTVRGPMRALAYTSWPLMLNESVVRAVVIRHLLANDGQLAADQEMRSQRGRGFVWMDELVALLGEYESNRATYPTFSAFMPRVVEYYNGLAPRIDHVLADFESRRPRIVSASIGDSAVNVDPRLDRIVYQFDHPVDAIVTLVGNHGGSTPVITSAVFDDRHTTLTLGVKLEPGREYILPLGPGALVGRDGYPLQESVLHFRTAAADRLRTDWADLERYRAANAALSPPSAGERRVVFFGNSITESWTPFFAAMFPGRSYIGRGISGQTTPQLLVRFRQDVVALAPAIVVILAGTNDIAGNTGPSTQQMIQDNLTSMTEIAQANGIRVVLSSVLPVFEYSWAPGLAPAPKIAALNAWMKAYAARVGAVYLDYHSAMADARQGLRADLTRDGVHPNETGYRLMTPLAEAAIARALSMARPP